MSDLLPIKVKILQNYYYLNKKRSMEPTRSTQTDLVFHLLGIVIHLLTEATKQTKKSRYHGLLWRFILAINRSVFFEIRMSGRVTIAINVNSRCSALTALACPNCTCFEAPLANGRFVAGQWNFSSKTHAMQSPIWHSRLRCVYDVKVQVQVHSVCVNCICFVHFRI